MEILMIDTACKYYLPGDVELTFRLNEDGTQSLDTFSIENIVIDSKQEGVSTEQIKASPREQLAFMSGVDTIRFRKDWLYRKRLDEADSETGLRVIKYSSHSLRL